MTSKESSIIFLVAQCLMLGAGIASTDNVIAELAMTSALFVITLIIAHNLASSDEEESNDQQ